MGSDPTTLVVNADQRSWDHSNLFLVGSGVFPTVATGNPTLTIAALALRAASNFAGGSGGRRQPRPRMLTEPFGSLLRCSVQTR